VHGKAVNVGETERRGNGGVGKMPGDFGVAHPGTKEGHAQSLSR
jgi:hypothetical protein